MVMWTYCFEWKYFHFESDALFRLSQTSQKKSKYCGFSFVCFLFALNILSSVPLRIGSIPCRVGIFFFMSAYFT